MYARCMRLISWTLQSGSEQLQYCETWEVTAYCYH
jgi:hypothetical protein